MGPLYRDGTAKAEAWLRAGQVRSRVSEARAAAVSTIRPILRHLPHRRGKDQEHRLPPPHVLAPAPQNPCSAPPKRSQDPLEANSSSVRGVRCSRRQDTKSCVDAVPACRNNCRDRARCRMCELRSRSSDAACACWRWSRTEKRWWWSRNKRAERVSPPRLEQEAVMAIDPSQAARGICQAISSAETLRLSVGAAESPGKTTRTKQRGRCGNELGEWEATSRCATHRPTSGFAF